MAIRMIGLPVRVLPFMGRTLGAPTRAVVEETTQRHPAVAPGGLAAGPGQAVKNCG
jgi:hypothetical protein